MCFTEPYGKQASTDANVSNNSASAPSRPASAAASSGSETGKSIPDTVNCPLCEQNVRSVLFQCGHSCCRDCADTRVQSLCHVCGTAIQKRLNLF